MDTWLRTAFKDPNVLQQCPPGSGVCGIRIPQEVGGGRRLPRLHPCNPSEIARASHTRKETIVPDTESRVHQ